MFNNQPNNPADFFTYVDGDRGAPVWVYVDLDIMEVPEGTLGLSFTFDNPVDDRNTNDIWCFNEAIDVAQWHNYFRLPHWPANVFRSLQDSAVSFTRTPGPAGDDDPPEELLDAAAELYYYKVEYNYADDEVDAEDSPWPRDPHTAFQSFCVPHQRGPRAFSISHGTWNAPASLSRMLAAIDDGSDTLSQWVYFSSGEIDHNNDSQLIYLTERGIVSASSSDDFKHEGFRGAAGSYRIPYYRSPSWPPGLFCIIDNYRHEGELAQIPSYVMGATTGSPSAMTRPPRLGLDYARYMDISGATSVVSQIIHGTEPESAVKDWWFWDGDSLGDSGCVHISRAPNEHHSSYSIDSGYADQRLNQAGDLTGGSPNRTISHSLYRYERWPKNIFCNAWTHDGTPEYGADAFGQSYDEETAGEPDGTTWENCITDPDAFAFQKWVKFGAWHPTVCNHQLKRTVWITDEYTVERDSFYPVDGNCIHPFMEWTNDERRYVSAYYRRRHFPEGLYRRLDNFQLSHLGDTEINHLPHDDEPPLSECGAPWHSQLLQDWVSAMVAETGRPLFSGPEHGAPWLRVWDPNDAEDARGGYNSRLEGSDISLHPGSAQAMPLGFDDDILTTLECTQGYSFAHKYRLGVDLLLDPCSIRYAPGLEMSPDAPDNALQLYLDKIAPFFREYKDPDIVTDVSDALYERVAVKRNAFDRKIRDTNRAIAEIQAQLNVKVGALGQIYEDMAYYGTMSAEKYKATLEKFRAMITHQGNLKYRARDNTLTLTLNVFEIMGQELGPMDIRLKWGNRNTFTVTVHPVRGCTNKSQHGHVHPHVSNGSDGQICWGSGSYMASALANGIDPLEYLFATATFLQTGYTPGDAYCRIGQWRETSTWFCEPCGDDHVEGQPCPYVCLACTERVEWDDHGHCALHNSCWEFDDRDSCPVCNGDTETGDAHNHADGDASAAE